jgi:hypothetical protein
MRSHTVAPDRCLHITSKMRDGQVHPAARSLQRLAGRPTFSTVFNPFWNASTPAAAVLVFLLKIATGLPLNNSQINT